MQGSWRKQVRPGAWEQNLTLLTVKALPASYLLYRTGVLCLLYSTERSLCIVLRKVKGAKPENREKHAVDQAASQALDE